MKKRNLGTTALATILALSLVGCAGGAKTTATTAAPADAKTDAATEAVKEDSSAENAAPSGDAKYVLRFGHTLTEQDLPHIYMEKWADSVREKTNGAVEIEVYANAQLGTEEDVIEQIRQGANMGWQTDFARLGSYVNDLSVCNAAYFIDNQEEAFALRDSQTIKDLNKQLADEYNICNIAWDWDQGPRHLFTNKPAYKPDDLKGLMIRTAPAPIWVESVNSLGCTAAALSLGEVYTGIQTKVVDGCELPYNNALNLKIHEVCKYVIETGHFFAINTMIVSQSWMDSLPEEYQKIFVDECNKFGEELTNALAEQTASSKQAMIDSGITVIGPDELDMEAFKANSQKAYDALNLSEVRKAVYNDIGKK